MIRSYRLLFLCLIAAAGWAQFRQAPQAWLPPLMSNPMKLSPQRMVDDEYPAIARDGGGRVWVAWSSCRTKSAKLPRDAADLDAWEWTDNGEDVIVTRWFDGKDWSSEQIVSSVPGVNYKPSVVPDENGVRVLWTARRNGKWAAYERRWRDGKWGAETPLPDSEDSLEIRAKRLADGSLLAVTARMAPPRIELQARRYEGGRWLPPARLDEGIGRCHRASLLSLPSGWIVAWDEEREGNYDIWVRTSNGTAQRITDSELWDTTPSLARTPEGRIWLAWERKETIGGRFSYQGRSIFAKFFDGSQWQWSPSPYSSTEPGRLTRHSRFWATQGISEERYPQLLARRNGELWLFWLGGGRMSSTSFSARVWKSERWSEPRLVFHDAMPYAMFALPSARRGVDFRSMGRGPYQTPLCNQMALALDDGAGDLWMAYEVPRRRHITDKVTGDEAQSRTVGYGADIYSHWVDLDEREYRLPRVVDDETPVAALHTRPYKKGRPLSLEIGGERYQLVFGDLHGHTENDAIGTVDMYYTHGLLVTGMDFIASTNHDFTPDFLTQSEWAMTQALSSVYNRIPHHVAFSGWEWTTAPADKNGGHRAMYFLRDNGPLYRSTTIDSDTVPKLYRLLRGTDVILQPHHRGWEGYDPDLQPIVEITSAWREPREESSQLKPSGKVRSVWEALERGYRIGFVGSGDTHWLGPGEDYGITGAYVRNLTREDVFDAIRKRRVFASTGARMLLDFRVNGTFMGGETSVSGRPRVEVAVTGDGDLERIEIVRDHRIVYASPCSGSKTSIEYIDQAGKPSDRRSSYYYARITQKNGMKAWSSPVWVDWK
jgi:hypothetical protein